MTVIEVAGKRATYEDGNWSCDDPSLLKLLLLAEERREKLASDVGLPSDYDQLVTRYLQIEYPWMEIQVVEERLPKLKFMPDVVY